MQRVSLGDRVKCQISGLTGIAAGRTEYLYGCIHILVKPEAAKDGKPQEGAWLDEGQLTVTKRGAKKAPLVDTTGRQGGPALGPKQRT